MIGMLRALRRMIAGETTRRPGGTASQRLFKAMLPRMSTDSTVLIWMDAERPCFCCLQGNQDTLSSATSLEQVDPATFFLMRIQRDSM